MATLQWTEIEPAADFIGPPKPAACAAGWESHVWVLTFSVDGMGISTEECRLCNDGAADDIGMEFLAGEFPVRIEFHKEVFGGYDGVETDVWWDVTPVLEGSNIVDATYHPDR